MKPGVATRLRAAELLGRVMDEGAHSNVIIAAETGERRAEVERLLMDALRYAPAVDVLLESTSARPLAELDPLVRSALRVGVMELLTGGDHHGVVDSTVEVVRNAGLGRATGFTNAILRKVTRGEVAPHADEAPALATGTPPWIRDRLVATWGEAEADAFLVASMQAPAIGVRLRPGATPIGDAVPGIEGARYVAGVEDIDAGAGHSVMDPASVAVATAVEAQPHETILDIAAAPGNKTAALWDDMEGAGLLVAADKHRRRVRSAARRLRAMGVDARWVIADGLHQPFGSASFDRILLDAPCTGLGTLRRRPEIKLRLDETSPARMAEIQRGLVAAALRLLRPGGRLVYSVCTVFAEETTGIAEEFGGRPPVGLPGRSLGCGVLLAPHITGTDGMFISVIDLPTVRSDPA